MPEARSTSSPRRGRSRFTEIREAELCYLLAFPSPAAVGETATERIRAFKDAPYFQPVDIHLHSLGEETLEMEGIKVRVLRQRYEGRVMLAECRFRLESPLSPEGLRLRLRLEAQLQRQIIPPAILKNGMYEEYSILLLEDIDSPDAFVKQHAPQLARFIRAQRERLDREDVEDTLISRVRYSSHDLTIVDWEGAILIAPDGNFQSDIELLKLGNYQLLRYRILDRSVDEALQRLNEEFGHQAPNLFRLSASRNALQRIIRYRLELLLDFEHAEQNLLLIGDWYTSKLYRAIRDEFYLEDWKAVVKNKLDNLENLISTIQENFSLSWQDLLETVQISGWLLLLAGYFILFFLESGLWKR